MQELNDEPLSAIDGDSFGISEYHQALAGFIQRCATPISIGVQGKSGSGKTSFLHTVEQLLDSSNHKIWINAWEHSLFCNPEQSLMAIITAISDEIASLSRSSKTIKEIKKASSTVMSSAAKIGAGLVAGRAGLQVVNDLQSKGPSIRELRRILELSINETLIKDNKKRFVFFIDDISRINPKTAVKVLELLKNIFHLPNCVFVLSIDYETIQRGLVDLFGEPSGDNDHEFRAFYEKIIQVPFLMPTEEHDSVDYTADILVKAGYLESEKITEKDKEDLHHLVYNSISGNPRGLKRLINSLILITPLIEDMEKTSDRLIIFAIVCLQVSCPPAYRALHRAPEFFHWDEKRIARITGTTMDDDDKGLLSMFEHEEEFDEEWEKALFALIRVYKGLWPRIFQTARFMNQLKLMICADENSWEVYLRALKLSRLTKLGSE